MSAAETDDERDVRIFKEFLRINTMHPNPNLGQCVEWLRVQADELGLRVAVHEFHAGYPVVVMTKDGTDPTLPSVVLNCHMDVVPFVAEKWDKLPAGETPFSAYEDAEGRIYARGAQDMKCVGAQYLSALRRLGGKDAKFLRTVHTLWVPDEEIGGPRGMQAFISSGVYKELNIGMALDEGLAHDENKFVVYYSERACIWLVVSAEGTVGHASKLLEDTAAERIGRVVAFMTQWRDANVEKVKAGKLLGDVTSVNWTFSHHGTTSDGGKTYAYNVVPSNASAGFDVRIAAEDYETFTGQLEQLIRELNLKAEYPNGPPTPKGPPSSRSSTFFHALTQSLQRWGAQVEAAVFPAGTDANYLRCAGVNAYGFSPMRNLPSMLHDHNEYLPRSTYLEGVRVYSDLIATLANVAAASDAKL